MALRAHDGDFDALCLSFAVPQFVYGDQPVPPHLQRTVNLKPGGADLAVTRANRVEYIYLVAHYRLNLQLRRPSAAAPTRPSTSTTGRRTRCTPAATTPTTRW